MVKLATQKSQTSQTQDSELSGDLGSVALRNVIWAALEKIGGKEKQTDEMPQGSSHAINLNIEGDINGVPFQQLINSVVNIGFEQTKSSSVNPQVPELVGYILSKLNRVTRNRILQDIPQEFADNDNQLPVTRPVIVEEAKHMLKQLRTKRQITARGAVRCEYTL